MDEQRWFRATAPGRDAAVLVAALAEVLPAIGTTCFTVRRPEVHWTGSAWGSRLLHDGKVICGADVTRIVETMIEDGRIWCELDSPLVRLHPSEESVYLGLSTEVELQPDDCPQIRFEPMDESPFGVPEAVPRRQALSERFWDGVRRSADESGPLVLLAQWAGGIGGENWYLLRSSADVEPAIAELVPRAVVSLFSSAAIRWTGKEPAGSGSVADAVDLFGDLRWLRAAALPRLAASMVDDEEDLKDKLSAAEPDDLLFAWPAEEVGPLEVAACADPDGVVRTSL